MRPISPVRVTCVPQQAQMSAFSIVTIRTLPVSAFLLRRYIAKRDSTLEAELQKAAQRLYEKVVPAAVQEYISDCTQDDPVRKPQKKSEAQV